MRLAKVLRQSASRVWPIVLAVAAGMPAVVCRAEDGKAARRPNSAPQRTADSVSDEPIQIPDGTPQKIMAFIHELQSSPPVGQTPAERRQYGKKVYRATVAACDKILAAKPDKEIQSVVQLNKLEALWILNQLDESKALDELIATATKLEADSRPKIAGYARMVLYAGRFLKTGPDDVKQAKSLVNQIAAQLAKGEIDDFYLMVIDGVAQRLEEIDQPAVAMDAYRKFADAIEEHEGSGLARLAADFRKDAEKLSVIGKPVEISGTLLNGRPFDWSPYKGKVVLIDFWATWCGPCRDELPNVKQTYEMYHNRGFDVIGVDLDEERAELDGFLREEKLPWANLVGTSEDESGWNHPLARRYNVHAIPATLLVNRDGKIVAINVRGERLVKRVAQLVDQKVPQPR